MRIPKSHRETLGTLNRNSDMGDTTNRTDGPLMALESLRASLFSPTDMQEANMTCGAMCGHGALAAALGIPVMAAMSHFTKPKWVNVPMMKAAIHNAGYRWERIPKPSQGMTAVILIQFLGPWTNPGVPPAAACKYRHWVATRGGFIWDANFQEWQYEGGWKRRFVEIYPPRATGATPWGALQVIRRQEA